MRDRRKKHLVGVSYENDIRINGYHVLCNHCDAIFCDFTTQKSANFATIQFKTKHHFDHSCSLMKGKTLIELTDDEVRNYNSYHKSHFNRTCIKWKDVVFAKAGRIKKWHYDLKHVFLTKEVCDTCMDGTCETCGTSKKEGALMSVDRLNSWWFYTDDNCRPLCIICNEMKSTYSDKFVMKHFKKIAEYQQSKAAA